MTSFWAYIKNLYDRFVHGDLSKILGQFDKVVIKLESYVTLEQDALAKVHTTIASLNALRDEKNQSIDKAYRTIHNISSLSA